MTQKQDIQWLMMEGYLTQLYELDVSHDPSVQQKTYNYVQILVMYLVANRGPITSMGPIKFPLVMKAYKEVVDQMFGGREGLATAIQIPPLDPKKDANRFGEIFDSLPPEYKNIITNIKNAVEYKVSEQQKAA